MVEDHIHLVRAINYLPPILISFQLIQIDLDTLFVFCISACLPLYFWVHMHLVLATIFLQC